MYGTLHETVTQSDLTYSFSGSSITACAKVTGNTSVSLWTCSVDHVQIITIVDCGTGSTYNDLNDCPILCCYSVIELNAQVQHEIYISATGSKDHPISFDYLTYKTSLAMPVADLLITPVDAISTYIEGWEAQYVSVLGMIPSLGLVAATAQPDANFTFDFYGSSILWFGFYNTSFVGHSMGEFSYSLDSTSSDTTGGTLFPNEAMPSLNGSDTVQFLLFQTFALPRGQHRLEVRHSSGDSDKAIPLTLTQLVVQNSTINPNSTTTPTLTPSAAPNARTNGARPAHLAIILGCCGAAALALLILGIFFARRRVKRRRDRASPESGTSSLIEPFNHDPASAPVETHHKGQPPSGVQEQVVVETAEVQVDAPPSYVTGPHDS
ncbi:hypothetical protein GALMADRAFT_1138159 [Galerina marginata CBS 339.88]|uniref:Uncharacterized protein n=1 Tax=Galerina marginata (strain CBS 339.88) TaxID=685588 RepID=A0A067SJQ1_GALM3|nr:hypothetical protein GALMADRAFT_1138159 [Galerina marginata CBS 339.88]